ncbi:molybdopterin-dependent oxidoreductase [Candidatus Woesearchaeota archaeon]|nr:molybdopterin-dependent oxidoreductase [Candidatus Woesearchaeota archaeon]
MRRIIFLLVLILFLSGCTNPTDYEEIQELKEVEVNEYEGKKLDSFERTGEVGIKGTQYIDIDEYKLEITGLVEEEKSLSYEEVLDMQSYKKVVTLHCVEGWSDTLLWEGVLVKDLFSAKEGANTVIFYAVDGYSTALPLDYIVENDIIMAYKINDMILPAGNGFPFQLVAEDKYGIKWIKWITKIELSDDEDYLGYWEKRGYSNTANVGESVFK